MTAIRSRDNEKVKRWSRLVRDGRARRSEGRTLLEGPHLIMALLDRGLAPLAWLVTERALEDREVRTLLKRAGADPIVLADTVFAHVVDTETPQGIAAEIAIPQTPEPLDRGCAFLEGIQDPGNVGAILRSAAAFGLGSVVLDRACADPWSPKVLRGAMGGHFALSVRQVADLGNAVLAFKGRTLCAATRGGRDLRAADVSGRLGWVFGSEGRGVSPGLQEKAEGAVTIALAPGAESLNVAAAAAVCFYEAFCRAQ